MDLNIGPVRTIEMDGDRPGVSDALVLREPDREDQQPVSQSPLDSVREQIGLTLPTTDTSSPTAVLKVHELARARWIGQVFQTYLLFELDGEIMLDRSACRP